METVSRGRGALFLDPSSTKARERFREKSRSLHDKRMTVSEAVSRYIPDGAYMALGGFGSNRIATSVLHEILRQRRKNLGLCGHTETHSFQILCAGHAFDRCQTLDRVDISYVVGLEARGLSAQARRVMESGTVRFTEWSNYTLALRLKAAAMGVPFLPAHSLLGTDTFRESAACAIHCPFTGEKLAAVPALYPDVAVLHVHEADRFGNCRIRGTIVSDPDIARASHRVIVTCERLVTDEEIRSDPSRTVIPYFCVDAVCEVPFGSYPANMPYCYYSDEEHLRGWLEAESDSDRYRAWLERYIFGVRDFPAYLEQCGGLNRLRDLHSKEFMLDHPT